MEMRDSSVEAARIQKWIRILGENDVEMSKIAAQKLAEMRATEAVPALITAMEKRHVSVSLAATRALGEIGDARAVPALIKTLLHHYDVTVNTAAAEALGQLRQAEAVPALKETIENYLTQNRDRYERIHSLKRGLFVAAVRALQHIGTAEARRIAREAERVDSL